MKIWEKLIFFKNIEIWNRNIFQNNEVKSLKLVLPDKFIVKVYFAILGAFKISSLGCNYAAIWKFEKNLHLKKKSKFEMGISS